MKIYTVQEQMEITREMRGAAIELADKMRREAIGTDGYWEVAAEADRQYQLAVEDARAFARAASAARNAAYNA